jgi:hypothetical protein
MPGKKPLVGATRAYAYRMLHDVAQLLDRSDIPYILEAGTLLGVIRENRLLPWDTDLDMTIRRKDAPRLLDLRGQFRRAGYRTRVRYHQRSIGPFKKGDIRLLKVQLPGFLYLSGYSLLDIFVKYEEGERYAWIVSADQPVIKYCPRHFYDDRKTWLFDGYPFQVPRDPEGYLEYHYGPQWRVPVKTWDFRLDDACEKTILP